MHAWHTVRESDIAAGRCTCDVIVVQIQKLNVPQGAPGGRQRSCIGIVHAFLNSTANNCCRRTDHKAFCSHHFAADH